MPQTLPIPNLPNWIMDIQLGANAYTLRGLWNESYQSWTLSIATIDGVPLISGMRLVLNWPLLLASSDERLPSGELIVVDPARRQKTDPGRNDFEPNRLRLVFVEAGR